MSPPTKESLAHWLLKSEPKTYAFSRLQKEKRTVWDGVRNFEARKNLRAMSKGDLALFYHSGDDKAVVGIARIVREAYQDPTTTEDWSVVDVEFVRPIETPVTLADLKQHPKLKNMVVVKRSRLSVSAVTEAEFATVLSLGSKS